MLSLLCATLCGSSMGFTTSNSLIRPRPSFSQIPTPVAPLTATRTDAEQRVAIAQLPRLSPEEEAELLRQTVELQRLVRLEEEMALKSPTFQLPLVSVRAQALGYGDELDEYEDAKCNGQKARETLVTRNMGLVHYTVNQILGKGKDNRLNSLSREDLIQEGAIGLARAVDKWNPAIGGRFSTYAVYWIRAAVLRCIAERDDVVRVPDHVSRAVREINKAARRLGINMDSEGILWSASWKDAHTAKLLAEEAGLTDKNFAEAMKVRSRRYTGGYVSFESWMQKGQDMQSDVPTAANDLGISTIESEQLRSMLSKFLRPKEVEALSYRYGLVRDNAALQGQPQNRDYLAEAEEELFGTKPVKKAAAKKMIPVKGKWGEAMSFTEVGKHMQVSAEYGRKLCHAGLNKLRQAAEEGRLEPGLMY
jgi:RNA polymerase nonessential primary-like sigma factor